MQTLLTQFLFLQLLLTLLSVCAGQERQFRTSQRLQLGTTTNLSAAIRAGDLDQDGDIDLIVANGRHWPQQNMLFLNQGRARFNVARSLGSDLCTSYTCEPADLDGDGDLDIAVANDSAPCSIYLNDGDANFAKHCEVGSPSSVRSLTAKDLDGDGDIDLLFTCRGAANRIHFNDGKANFERTTNFGTSNDSTINVAVVDLNKDGHQDLILANRDAQPNTILLSTGLYNRSTSNQLFAPARFFGSPKTSSRAIAIADFDGDGKTDWVTANIDAPNTIYFGDGEGGVRQELAVGRSDGRSYCVSTADLNQDKLEDIVVGNAGQANEIYFNLGVNKGFTSQLFGQSDSITYGLCIADVTGDGFMDIAVANSGQLNRLFINQPRSK